MLLHKERHAPKGGMTLFFSVLTLLPQPILLLLSVLFLPTSVARPAETEVRGYGIEVAGIRVGRMTATRQAQAGLRRDVLRHRDGKGRRELKRPHGHYLPTICQRVRTGAAYKKKSGSDHSDSRQHLLLLERASYLYACVLSQWRVHGVEH